MIIDYSQRIPLSIFLDFRYNELIFIDFINCHRLSVLSIELLGQLNTIKPVENEPTFC